MRLIVPAAIFLLTACSTIPASDQLVPASYPTEAGRCHYTSANIEPVTSYGLPIAWARCHDGRKVRLEQIRPGTTVWRQPRQRYGQSFCSSYRCYLRAEYWVASAEGPNAPPANISSYIAR